MLNFAGSHYLSKFNGLLLWKLAQKDNFKVALYKYPGTIIARAYTITVLYCLIKSNRLFVKF